MVCIVAVDNGWGMERSAHRFKGIDPERHQGTDISAVVRYDLIAAAMGCHGEHVTDHGRTEARARAGDRLGRGRRWCTSRSTPS